MEFTEKAPIIVEKQAPLKIEKTENLNRTPSDDIVRTLEDEPSNWVLANCMALCLASYEEQSVEKLKQPGVWHHDLSKVSVTDPELYPGKILVAEGSNPKEDGQEYYFIAFRGSSNYADLLADVDSSPTVCELGVIHNGFLNRSKSLPLQSILRACTTKKVVITGHSLGGACATVLTARFFASYGHYSFSKSNVTCVTFASPLVGGSTLGEYLLSRKKLFHNYIHGDDVVPKLLTVMDIVLPSVVMLAVNALHLVDPNVGKALSAGIECACSFKPFGNYYLLEKDIESGCKNMSNNEISEYFSSLSKKKFEITPAMVTDHSMVTYFNKIWSSIIKHEDDSNEVKGHLIEPLYPPPEVISCFIKAKRLVVRGDNLLYVSRCELSSGKFYPLEVEWADIDCAIFFCPDELTSKLNKNVKMKREVVVASIFGQRSSAVAVPFEIAPSEMLFTPEMLLSSVLPLVTLLVRDEGPQSAFIDSKLKKMYYHCRQLGSALPIEFAFRTMKRESKDLDGVIINTFLNRFTKVEVPWDKLFSEMMLTTIQESIDLLSSGKLNEDELIDRYRVYRRVFADVNSPTDESWSNYSRVNLSCVQFKTDMCNEVFVVSKTPLSTEAFWTIVCNDNVLVSVDLVGDSHYPDAVLFEGERFSFTNGFTVEHHATKREQTGRKGCSLVRRKYFVTRGQNNVMDVFYHLSIDWEDEVPKSSDMDALMCRLRDIADGYKVGRKVLLLCQSEYSHAGCFIFTRALMTLPPSAIKKRCEEVFSKLSDSHGPSKGELFLMSEKQKEFALNCGSRLCDKTILETIMDTIKPVAVKDPRFRAENLLRGLLHAMRSDYASAKCSVISGESIMMQVKNAFTGEEEPFLDLFPKPLTTEELANFSVESKRYLVNHAAEASAKAEFLSMLLEDAMQYGDAKLERQETSTAKIVAKGAAALVKSIGIVGYGALKTLRFLSTFDRSNMIDVERSFQKTFYSVFYSQTSFSSYPDIVEKLCQELKMPIYLETTLEEKERFIADLLPKSIGKLSIREIIIQIDSLFKGSDFAPLLEGHSKELMVFYLKTIYHCYYLKLLRKEVRLITVSGMTNAGKTTLVKNMFGPTIVTAKTGVGSDRTTIFPSAYFLPDKPSSIYADLPGCTDDDTYEMARVFMTLGDITIFLIQAGCPKRPKDPVLKEIVKNIMERCSGPRLICINAADTYITPEEEDEELSRDEILAKIAREREEWRTISFLGLENSTSGKLWKTEERHEESVIASLQYGRSAISVWLTAFRRNSKSPEGVDLFFGVEDVQTWTDEVKHLADINQLV